jgi:hypothetical protein
MNEEVGREECLATLNVFNCARVWIMVDRHSGAQQLAGGRGTLGEPEVQGFNPTPEGKGCAGNLDARPDTLDSGPG